MNVTEVKQYSSLAYYYDYLLQDEEALNLWLKYIESVPFSSCLELASGSGLMASILYDKGYDITASDISEEMREVALKRFNGEYLILNMADYKLERKYDLILCICDSLNYLNEDELESFFRCAHEHLNEKGRIIFDMHHPQRLNEFAEEYIEEGQLEDGNFYQWTIMSDREEKTINEHFTFYLKNDMIQEHHVQNVFSINDVKKKMESYFNVRVIEDFVPDEKILFTGEKK